MRILITGASRGIGRGLFESYTARGEDVIGTYRDIPPEPAQRDWMPLDVRNPASHGALAEALQDRPLDLLICNAGIYPDKGQDLETGYTAPLWTESFATNVTGVFLTIQALLPNLRAGSRPRIAIISSAMGSDARAPGGSYIYRASKAAALNLGRNLAVDLRPQGIAVGIYHPGWVRTDMGGAAGQVALETSVSGLARRFDALDLDTTGCFMTYDGESIPF